MIAGVLRQTTATRSQANGAIPEQRVRGGTKIRRVAHASAEATTMGSDQQANGRIGG